METMCALERVHEQEYMNSTDQERGSVFSHLDTEVDHKAAVRHRLPVGLRIIRILPASLPSTGIIPAIILLRLLVFLVMCFPQPLLRQQHDIKHP